LGLLSRARELQINVVATDRIVDIVAEGFDIALGTGRVVDSSLVGRRLRPWDNVVCASPGYLRRRTLPRRPEDLRDHACIEFHRDAAAPGIWTFARNRQRARVAVSGRVTTN